MLLKSRQAQVVLLQVPGPGMRPKLLGGASLELAGRRSGHDGLIVAGPFLRPTPRKCSSLAPTGRFRLEGIRHDFCRQLVERKENS